jgi:hypothetical protein
VGGDTDGSAAGIIESPVQRCSSWVCKKLLTRNIAKGRVVDSYFLETVCIHVLPQECIVIFFRLECKETASGINSLKVQHRYPDVTSKIDDEWCFKWHVVDAADEYFFK